MTFARWTCQRTRCAPNVFCCDHHLGFACETACLIPPGLPLVFACHPHVVVVVVVVVVGGGVVVVGGGCVAEFAERWGSERVLGISCGAQIGDEGAIALSRSFIRRHQLMGKWVSD